MYRAETGGVGWFYSLEVARMIWELSYHTRIIIITIVGWKKG